MRAYALPLQILLALVLVLNGIGGAVAGVLAGLPPPVVAPAATVADNALSAMPGDCAGHADAVANAAGPGTVAPDPAADCHSTGGSDCGSDCGNTPQCRQACMHASLAVAVAPSPMVGVARPRTDASLHRLAAGHPAPPLTSPIRPPIA
ncbi:CopL family metal-binding regulatory protein [Luteimonas sp. A501]